MDTSLAWPSPIVAPHARQNVVSDKCFRLVSYRCPKLVEISRALVNRAANENGGTTAAVVKPSRADRSRYVAFFFRRRTATAAARPAPKSEIVTGSGTGTGTSPSEKKVAVK